MRHRTESGLSSRSRKFVLLLVFLAVVFGAPARAQKSRTAPASPPKYDLKSEAKFKGTVADLQLPPKGSEKEIAHLVLKKIGRASCRERVSISVRKREWNRQ